MPNMVISGIRWDSIANTLSLLSSIWLARLLFSSFDISASKIGDQEYIYCNYYNLYFLSHPTFRHGAAPTICVCVCG